MTKKVVKDFDEEPDNEDKPKEGKETAKAETIVHTVRIIVVQHILRV